MGNIVNIISFAWTTPALLAGRKTVTRRDWNDAYAMRFRRGDFLRAYSRSPRHGGCPVGLIRLTADPKKESTHLAPATDYEAEGFAFLEEQGLKVDGLSPRTLWCAWLVLPRVLWVIRFEFVRT